MRPSSRRQAGGGPGLGGMLVTPFFLLLASTVPRALCVARPDKLHREDR